MVKFAKKFNPEFSIFCAPCCAPPAPFPTPLSPHLRSRAYHRVPFTGPKSAACVDIIIPLAVLPRVEYPAVRNNRRASGLVVEVRAVVNVLGVAAVVGDAGLWWGIVPADGGEGGEDGGGGGEGGV